MAHNFDARALEGALAMAAAALMVKNGAIDTLHGEVQRLTRENEILAKLTSLKGGQQVGTLLKKLHRAETEAACLTTRLAAEQHTTSLQHAKARIAVLNSDLSTAQQRISDLQEAEDEVAELKSSLAEANERIKSLQLVIAAATAPSATAPDSTNGSTTSSSSHQQVERLTCELAEAYKRIAQLEDELEDAGAAAQELWEYVQGMSDAGTRSVGQLSSFLADVDDGNEHERAWSSPPRSPAPTSLEALAAVAAGSGGGSSKLHSRKSRSTSPSPPCPLEPSAATTAAAAAAGAPVASPPSVFNPSNSSLMPRGIFTPLEKRLVSLTSRVANGLHMGEVRQPDIYQDAPAAASAHNTLSPSKAAAMAAAAAHPSDVSPGRDVVRPVQ